MRGRERRGRYGAQGGSTDGEKAEEGTRQVGQRGRGREGL